MQTINWKGHGAMFGANAIWGLMSPVAKFVMLGGIVTPLAVTDLRIVGAMIPVSYTHLTLPTIYSV